MRTGCQPGFHTQAPSRIDVYKRQVFTVLTGTVLTVFLAITLGLAQKQTQLSAQSMFDASVDTLIVTLQTGSVSDTALAQTEAADGLLIFITDNGTPLFFSGG